MTIEQGYGEVSISKAFAYRKPSAIPEPEFALTDDAEIAIIFKDMNLIGNSCSSNGDTRSISDWVFPDFAVDSYVYGSVSGADFRVGPVVAGTLALGYTNSICADPSIPFNAYQIGNDGFSGQQTYFRYLGDPAVVPPGPLLFKSTNTNLPSPGGFSVYQPISPSTFRDIYVGTDIKMLVMRGPMTKAEITANYLSV